MCKSKLASAIAKCRNRIAHGYAKVNPAQGYHWEHEPLQLQQLRDSVAKDMVIMQEGEL